MCTVRLKREVHPLTRRELGRRRQEHRAEKDEEQRIQQLAKHLTHRHAGGGTFGRRKPDPERQRQ